MCCQLEMFKHLQRPLYERMKNALKAKADDKQLFLLNCTLHQAPSAMLRKDEKRLHTLAEVSARAPKRLRWTTAVLFALVRSSPASICCSRCTAGSATSTASTSNRWPSPCSPSAAALCPTPPTSRPSRASARVSPLTWRSRIQRYEYVSMYLASHSMRRAHFSHLC